MSSPFSTSHLTFYETFYILKNCNNLVNDSLSQLQSPTPGNCLFKFLLLCLIFYDFLFFICNFICLFVLCFIYLSNFFHFFHLLNLIKCTKLEIFKSNYNKFKSWQYIWFCMLLLHFSTCAYLFSPDKGSCFIFSTQNYCWEFLASYAVTFQCVINSWRCIIWYCCINKLIVLITENTTSNST